MTDAATDARVTSAQIARLAGVGRAAVSNWRRRYPDFPKPVGGSPTSPMFVLAEVEKWLTDTGKGEQLRTSGVTDTGTHRLEPASHGASQTSYAADDLADGRNPPTSDSLPQAFARMVAALLPRTTNGPVLDPACGQGGLLVAVADRFGACVELVGQEVDETTATRARVRLHTDVPDSSAEIHGGDSLADDRLRAYLDKAAAVVCEPPSDQPQWPADQLATDARWVFGLPAPRDAELAWVQHCYAHLRPHGTAVIAVTPRACMQPSGRQIRAAMVRTGAIHAVVALPKGIGWAGADVFLWVLRRPYGDPDHTICLVDLAGVEPVNLPADHAAWQAVFADPALCREVPGIELLDDDVSLLPSRFVTRPGDEVAQAYALAVDRLPALLERIGSGLPRLAPNRARPNAAHVTLGELERAGSLRVRQRGTTPRAGDVLMRSGGRPPVVATGDDDEHAVTQVIEVDAERLDPWFVAAFLGAEASAIPVTNTLGALSREDLRRCRIPRVSRTEQLRFGQAFRKLDELAAVLRKAAELSATVIETAAYGLRTGALAPPD